MSPDNDIRLGYLPEHVQSAQRTLFELKEEVQQVLKKNESSPHKNGSQLFLSEWAEYLSVMSEQMGEAEDRLQGFEHEFSKRLEERMRRIQSLRKESRALQAIGGSADEDQNDTSSVNDDLTTSYRKKFRSGIKKLEEDVYHSTRRALEFVTNPRFRRREPKIEVTPELIEAADDDLIQKLAQEAREDLQERLEVVRNKLQAKKSEYSQWESTLSKNKPSFLDQTLEALGKKLEQVLGWLSDPQEMANHDEEQIAQAIKPYRDRVTLLVQHVQTLEQASQGAQQALETTQVENAELHHQLQQGSAERDQLRTELQRLVRALGAQQAATEQAIRAAEHQKKDAEKRIEELESMLEHQVRASRDFKNRVSEDTTRLSRQLEGEQEETERVRKQAALLQEEVEALRIFISRDQRTSAEQRVATQAATSRAEKAERDAEQARAEVRKLQAHLQHVLERTFAAEQDAAQSREEIQKLLFQLREATARTSAAEERSEGSEKDLQQARRQVQGLAQVLEVQRGRLRQLERKSQATSQELEDQSAFVRRIREFLPLFLRLNVQQQRMLLAESGFFLDMFEYLSRLSAEQDDRHQREQQKSHQWQERSESLQSALQEEYQKRQAAEQLIQQLRSQVTELERRIATLVGNQQAAVKQQRIRSAEAQAHAEALQNRAETAETQLAQAQAKLEETRKDAEQTMAEQSEVSAAQEQALGMLQKQVQNLRGARQEADTAAEELARVKAQLTQLQRERDEARAEAAGLRTEMAEVKDVMRSAVRTLNEDRAQLREELERERATHHESLKTVSDLRSQSQTLREELSTLQNLLQETREQASNQIRTAEEKGEKMKNAVLMLREGDQQLRSKIEKLQKELADIREAYTLERGEKNLAEQRAAQLARRLEQLETELEQLKTITIRQKLEEVLQLAEDLNLDGNTMLHLVSAIFPKPILEKMVEKCLEYEGTGHRYHAITLLDDAPYKYLRRIVRDDSDSLASFDQIRLVRLDLDPALKLLGLLRDKKDDYHAWQSGPLDNYQKLRAHAQQYGFQSYVDKRRSECYSISSRTLLKHSSNAAFLDYLREQLTDKEFSELEKILIKLGGYNNASHFTWAFERSDDFFNLLTKAGLPEDPGHFQEIINHHLRLHHSGVRFTRLS